MTGNPAASCFHTENTLNHEWWMVDVGTQPPNTYLERVYIVNRSDGGQVRLRNFVVAMTDLDPRVTAPKHDNYRLCAHFEATFPIAGFVNCSDLIWGRYFVLTYHQSSGPQFLHVCEIELFVIKIL